MAASVDIQGNQITGREAALAWGRLAKALPDSNYTLTNLEYINRHYDFSGTLTAGRNVVFPLTAGAEVIVSNGTTGGFAVTVIGATGTGIAVAATKTAILRCDGVNWLRCSPDT